MKKILLSGFLMLALYVSAFSQMTTIQINGYVLDPNNGAVANQTVYIMSDSLNGFFYYNTVTTNNNGYFTDNVNVPSNAQVLFYIYTFDCNGTLVMAQGVSTNAPINVTLTVCTGNPPGCQAYYYAVPDSSNPQGYGWQFIDVSQGNITNWHWSFGDGTTSNQQNPFHIYNQGGTYLVCLSINGPNCQDSHCDTVFVGGGLFCSADFSANPDSNGFGFHFFDLSMGNPISWAWDFGDGTTSALQNPYHAFNGIGNYNVCLTIAGANGCFDTFCSTITVTLPSTCQADWNSFADTLNPMNIYFQDLSTGNMTHWSWSFGDGTGSSLQYPSHVYASPGWYMVCLDIWDNNNTCFDSYCASIHVGNATGCQADFYAVPDSSNPQGYGWQFIDVSQGNISNWYWHFGDGTTSNQQNPFHVYNQGGVYSVCLTITGPNCQDSHCDSVFVGGVPCHNYIGYTSLGFTFNFFSNVTGGTPPYTYLWDFGDGTTSTQSGPTHTFANAGGYYVTLTTTDANACTFTSTTYVFIQGNNFNLYGQVYASNTWLDHGIAVLYAGVPGANFFFPVDSASIDSVGLYFFHNLQPGIYYIKAYPTFNSAYYSTYLPTYYPSSPFWGQATAITLPPANNPYNISLTAVTPASPGPGNIGGSINTGNKLISSGTPAPGVEILLLNTNNLPLGVDYADNQGMWGFSNLALGTYKVYAEKEGIPCTPLVVTLTTANPGSNNISLVITPGGITTSINETLEITEISNIFPNPANDKVILTVNTEKPDKLKIQVLDLLGNEVYHSWNDIGTGKSQIIIPLEEMNSGTYILNITTENKLQLNRKISVIK